VAAAELVRSSFDGKVKPQRYALTNLMDTVEQVEGLDEQQPHETERVSAHYLLSSVHDLCSI
jgi:hypothetical protein